MTTRLGIQAAEALVEVVVIGVPSTRADHAKVCVACMEHQDGGGQHNHCFVQITATAGCKSDPLLPQTLIQQYP